MSVTLAVLGLGMVALGALLAALLLVRPKPPLAEPPRPMALAPRPAGGAFRMLRLGPDRYPHLPLLVASLGAGGVVWFMFPDPRLGLGALGLGPLSIWLYVRRQRAAYLRGFDRQFLPALDIIVRGLRSGMPVIAALQVVQRETEGPVRTEFRRLLDDLSLGLTLTQAVDRLAERVPLTEVRFFAVVIGLQSRTGGRLSETLENLAGTLRDRNQLNSRIRVVSQEARTSAKIIAALPVFVAGGLFLLNPAYISVLFTQTLGIVVLCVSLFWMGLGGFIMRRMTEINV